MRVGIALGSNVGDRLANLCEARDLIREFHRGDDSDFLQSSIYETEPIDCPPGTGPFLNAVIEIESEESPENLLEKTQQIESDLGRPAEREKNSPRTIDLDLLYAGVLEIDTPALQLPHPKMLERRFVLEPLAEIRKEIKTQGKSFSINDLLHSLSESGEASRRFQESW